MDEDEPLPSLGLVEEEKKNPTLIHGVQPPHG
jgi:hypothetical protein